MSPPGLHYVEDDALESVIDAATHEILTMDLPQPFVNPAIRTFFAERAAYDNVSAMSPLSFPPTLGDTLSAAEPPPVEWFRALARPEPTDAKVWAIYALLLEHEDLPPALYIGSGTSAEVGFSRRIQSYFTSSPTLPRLVKVALQKGYHISSIGMLCSTPLPTPSLVPPVRARFMALENYLSIRFHAVVQMVPDKYFQHLVSWPRSSVSWRPLGSHHPLSEAVRADLALTPEELEIAAVLRRERKAANVLKNAVKTRARAISARRFFCEICDKALQSQAALDKHLLTQSHMARRGGSVKKPLSQQSQALKAARHKAIAAKSFYCAACDKACPNDWELRRHNSTPKHAKEVKKLAKKLEQLKSAL